MTELRCRISPEQARSVKEATRLVDEAAANLAAAKQQAGLVIGTILKGYGVSDGRMVRLEGAEGQEPVLVAEAATEPGPHPEWTAGWEARDESVPGDIGEAVEAALS